MLYQTENRHGGDIYGGIALDFSANVSPLGTPRSVTDAIERALPELYRYPDPSAGHSYRRSRNMRGCRRTLSSAAMARPS